MSKFIFAGVFDPFTLGHVDVACRASKFCDELIIGIADTPKPGLLLDVVTRREVVQKIVGRLNVLNIRVEIFSGLLVDFVRTSKADAIIRGIRSEVDIDHEINIALMNKRLLPKIETIFLPSEENMRIVSSSLAKNVFFHGGDVSSLLPPESIAALRTKTK